MPKTEPAEPIPVSNNTPGFGFNMDAFIDRYFGKLEQVNGETFTLQSGETVPVLRRTKEKSE